jgi:hypothetical protein
LHGILRGTFSYLIPAHEQLQTFVSFLRDISSDATDEAIVLVARVRGHRESVIRAIVD